MYEETILLEHERTVMEKEKQEMFDVDMQTQIGKQPESTQLESLTTLPVCLIFYIFNNKDTQSFFDRYFDPMSSRKIAQELSQELTNPPTMHPKLEATVVLEAEPLLASLMSPEEIRAQEVYERSPPVPNTANTKVRSVLLPQLYHLYDQLMVPYSGIKMKYPKIYT